MYTDYGYFNEDVDIEFATIDEALSYNKEENTNE